MVFESKERLGEQVSGLLGALRERGDGAYAAVFEPAGILFESAEEGGESALLRGFLRERGAALFALPRHMADEAGPAEDPFAGWDDHAFLLAFVNGRVGILAACADAAALEADCGDLLSALVDRLLRFDERWRLDGEGRGLFVGRPRLDVIAIGREEAE